MTHRRPAGHPPEEDGGFTIFILFLVAMAVIAVAGLMSGCASLPPFRPCPSGYDWTSQTCVKRPTEAPTAAPTEAPAPTATPLPTVRPQPTATPSPATPPPTAPPANDCAVVEQMEHFMAPGDNCHVWRPESNRCLVDSTIRPICDDKHLDTWNGVCGKRSHDPDYQKPEVAFSWSIRGAEDLGPHAANSAQRWISAPEGTEVTVEVCIPEGAVTPDGCRITRRPNHCGIRTFLIGEKK